MVGIGRKGRSVKTLAGDVSFMRSVAECPHCRKSLVPLDLELGVASGEKMTFGVRRRVAFASSHGSFAGASACLKEMSGLDVSPAECCRVAEQDGKRLEELQRQRECRWSEPVRREARVAQAEIECARLVIEADATCVLTVSGEEHKSVYTAVAFDAGARGCKQDSQRRYLSEKRYTASALDMDDFSVHLKSLAHRMGLRQAQEVAFVADGAAPLWKWAEQNLPSGTVFIQDFWHVCEHLSHLATDLYGLGEQSDSHAALWRESLRHSQVDNIIADLRTERKRRRGKTRRRLDEEINYLDTGRKRMDYARFESEGWPIGSGAVEGTCKHLVKERFSLTGAHWRRKNIPHVLALRLSYFNNEWESDWNHICLN